MQVSLPAKLAPAVSWVGPSHLIPINVESGSPRLAGPVPAARAAGYRDPEASRRGFRQKTSEPLTTAQRLPAGFTPKPLISAGQMAGSIIVKLWIEQ